MKPELRVPYNLASILIVAHPPINTRWCGVVILASLGMAVLLDGPAADKACHGCGIQHEMQAIALTNFPSALTVDDSTEEFETALDCISEVLDRVFAGGLSTEGVLEEVLR